jgi:hypothetical protein
MWLAYRSRESKIIVACRIADELTNRTYEEYDLHGKYSDQGKSSSAPAVCELNGRLYIFWKASTGAHPGPIVFTSTEDGETWEDLQTTQFKSTFSPAVGRYRHSLYLAYLNASSEIAISSSFDGQTWSAPTVQHFAGSAANVKSPYPPSFSVSDGALTMFWGGGQPHSDATLYAPLDVAGINNPSGTVNTNSATPQKIDGGKWQTKVGNTIVFRSSNQTIISTSRNGEISIATDDQFEKRSNLTDQEPKAKSAAACGACLLPGFFGRANQEEWGLVLVYRGYGSDTKLYEVSIGRAKNKYELEIESLQAQVADLQSKEAKARNDLKAANDANAGLQTRITALETKQAQDAAKIYDLEVKNQQATGTTSQVERLKKICTDMKSCTYYVSPVQVFLINSRIVC